MSLKSLYLYREAIEQAVQSYPDYLEHKIDTHPGNRYNFKITIKGESVAMLNVINLVDGTTTLNTEVGKNKPLSMSIAEHICKACSLPQTESKRLYIQDMSDENFQTLLDFLDLDEKISISAAKAISAGVQYVIGWREGGCIFINRFNSKAFSVQGTSLHIKERLVEVLAKVLPYQEVISIQMQSLEVNITSDQILAETETLMPTAFNQLDETLKAIISPSIALRTANIELSDYSVFTFPILRGIEGVLRWALISLGIVVADKIGVLFNKLPNGRFVLSPLHRGTVNSPAIVDALNNLYNIYHSERHTIFHTNISIPTTRIIEDREEALQIIDDGVSMIEDLYSKMHYANIQAI